MTGREAAAALRKLASVIEPFAHVPFIKRNHMDEECQMGAASMLMLIRDLFTITGKEMFTRGEILVLLNDLQNDRDVFTIDLVAIMGEEE